MIPPDLTEEMLSAYVDGECSPDEIAEVEARLASDPQWRAILLEVESTRSSLRTLSRREPPAGFVEGLLATPLQRSATPRRTGAALAAIAAVIVGVVLAVPRDAGGDATPAVATLVDTHGATASFEADPVSMLAPIVAPSGLEP